MYKLFKKRDNIYTIQIKTAIILAVKLHFDILRRATIFVELKPNLFCINTEERENSLRVKSANVMFIE